MSGMSVNLYTELAGTRGSGGSVGGSGGDGRPAATLEIVLTRDGATDPDPPTDCAPKWYNPATNAWDLATITVTT